MTNSLKASLFALAFSLLTTSAIADPMGKLTLINNTDYPIHIGALDFLQGWNAPWYQSTTLTDPPLAPRTDARTPSSGTSQWDRWMVGAPCDENDGEGGQGACPSKSSTAMLHILKMGKDSYSKDSRVDAEEVVRFGLGDDGSTNFSFDFHKFTISVVLGDQTQFYSESSGGHLWGVGYPNVTVTVTQVD
jgi:hypothetical protein